MGPAAAAPKAPAVSDPIATGLLTPLHLDVSKKGVLVSQSFGGVISRVTRTGLRDVVVEEPAVEGGSTDLGGVASRGKTIAYLYASAAPGPTPDAPGDPVASQVKIRKPNGRTYVLANLLRFERKRNPDAHRTYGFRGLDASCIAEVNADPDAQAMGIVGEPYTGIVESNPYEIARAPHGGWYVADAAANTVLRVSKRGHIKVVYVGKPQPFSVTAEAAGALNLPECIAGSTYLFEPVPTDVEVTRSGRLVISQLPGGPEDPSLGARGSIVKVNPWTRRGHTVARGILGATNVAVGAHGKIYVTELFGTRVSVVRNGSVKPVVELPLPAAVEYFRGKLYVSTNVFPGPEGPAGEIVKVRVH